MNKPDLSICVFAYKQYEQIREFLDVAKTISERNIEILVSDDSEDDSIKKLVESYYDDRFRHIFNEKGHGADSNYLNAMEEAFSDYVWIFRSTDIVIPESVTSVIELIRANTDCALFHFSSCSGKDVIERIYKDERTKYVPQKYNSKQSSLWRSGTVHPSGYIVNKTCCDFELYRYMICQFFDDYLTSNVAFILQLADLAIKGESYFSSIVAWKYVDTLKRLDIATNSPHGKNPFGLEFEYSRYRLLFKYSESLGDEIVRKEVIKAVVHTFAKQILHVFGKRNSSALFLRHYGCGAVEFNSFIEMKHFIKVSNMLLERNEKKFSGLRLFIYREAILYGVIKPIIYKVRNK